jgi:uncharacterized protein (DUF302 family)
MIKDVVVCIDKQRVLARRSDEDHRRRKILYMHNGMVAKRLLPRPKA